MCASFRSRQEFSNEYLLATFGVDTTENEPLKVCQKITISLKKKLENTEVQELRQETTELRASAHELALAQDEARRSQMSVEELKVLC